MNAPQPLALDQFDFSLPEGCIAQFPVEPRDRSRLMVLTEGSVLRHHTFSDLPSLLQPEDLLVINRTQVIPARLHLWRPTGGKVELLLHTPVDGPLLSARTWKALGRPGKALKIGFTLRTAAGASLHIVKREGEVVFVQTTEALWSVLQKEGQVPIPPYLQRQHGATSRDAVDYQSMFAQTPGSVAAPTASLHFTPQVTASLAARGVGLADVVLHVGPGTFLPIRHEHADDVRQHIMHSELYCVPASTQKAIVATQAAGGRIVAVGTTAVRALEAWATSGCAQGACALYIYPGYRFRMVQGLITNFHMPRSTLLLLVCALAGRERIMAAYDAAIAAGYRFFSYGDAMLIL